MCISLSSISEIFICECINIWCIIVTSSCVFTYVYSRAMSAGVLIRGLVDFSFVHETQSQIES